MDHDPSNLSSQKRKFKRNNALSWHPSYIYIPLSNATDQEDGKDEELNLILYQEYYFVEFYPFIVKDSR